MQTRNYGLGSYLGFSPSVSLIYLSTKSTYELFFSEFEGLIWLNIWYYIVFSLRKQHLAGTESIPFNEIFDFMENLLFVLF